MSDKVYRKWCKFVVERRNCINSLAQKLKFKKEIIEDPRKLSSHYKKIKQLSETIEQMDKDIQEK